MGCFFFIFPLAASELGRALAAWPCPALLEPPRGQLLSSPTSRGRAGAELGLLPPYQQDSSSVLVQLLLFLRIPSSVCVLCLSRGTVDTESGAVSPAASPVPEQEKLRAAAFWGGGVVSLQGSFVGKAWPVFLVRKIQLWPKVPASEGLSRRSSVPCSYQGKIRPLECLGELRGIF